MKDHLTVMNEGIGRLQTRYIEMKVWGGRLYKWKFD